MADMCTGPLNALHILCNDNKLPVTNSADEFLLGPVACDSMHNLSRPYYGLVGSELPPRPHQVLNSLPEVGLQDMLRSAIMVGSDGV